MSETMHGVFTIPRPLIHLFSEELAELEFVVEVLLYFGKAN